MCHRFLLQITLLWRGREIVGERALDVARVCVVTLHKIRIIAVRRTDEIADRLAQKGVETTGKLVRFRNQRNHFILERLRGMESCRRRNRIEVTSTSING